MGGGMKEDMFIKGLNDMRTDLRNELKRMTDMYGMAGMIAREKEKQLDAVEKMYRIYKEGGRI